MGPSKSFRKKDQEQRREIEEDEKLLKQMQVTGISDAFRKKNDEQRREIEECEKLLKQAQDKMRGKKGGGNEPRDNGKRSGRLDEAEEAEKDINSAVQDIDVASQRRTSIIEQFQTVLTGGEAGMQARTDQLKGHFDEPRRNEVVPRVAAARKLLLRFGMAKMTENFVSVIIDEKAVQDVVEQAVQQEMAKNKRPVDGDDTPSVASSSRASGEDYVVRSAGHIPSKPQRQLANIGEAGSVGAPPAGMSSGELRHKGGVSDLKGSTGNGSK